MDFENSFDHLPLVPEGLLRQHHVHEPMDNRFRSAARLLQAIWREDKQLPIGTYIRADGRRTKLGSRLSQQSGWEGANFLSKEVASLAFREACYREVGALMDEARLFNNLLSSMPLAFNLFGPLRLIPGLGTSVIQRVFPGFDGTVTQVLFEHSPGRGDPRFTGDYTAFDVVLRYVKKSGVRGFIAFEIKYSETCNEQAARINDIVPDIARRSGCFEDSDHPALRSAPLQQFWRLQCLGSSMIDAGLYDEGLVVCVAPRMNLLAQHAAVSYMGYTRDNEKLAFRNVLLEDFLAAIAAAGADEYAACLHRRYTDFWLVDGEIELFLNERGRKRTSRTYMKTKPRILMSAP